MVTERGAQATSDEGADAPAEESPEVGAEILARGVAVTSGMLANAASRLETGSASTAYSIARGAKAVQATAHEDARQAAELALAAVQAVLQALGPTDAEALTPELAMLVVAQAREASAQLAIAGKASGAFATAAAATGVATEAAELAAAFELHMLANAVAAQKLVRIRADAPVAATPTPRTESRSATADVVVRGP